MEDPLLFCSMLLCHETMDGTEPQTWEQWFTEPPPPQDDLSLSPFRTISSAPAVNTRDIFFAATPPNAAMANPFAANPQIPDPPRRSRYGDVVPGTTYADYTQRCPLWIEIKPSTIPNAGLGAFATMALPKRAYLGEYLGDILDYDMAMNPDNMLDDAYFMQVGQHGGMRFPLKIIDAKSLASSNWTRFINCAASPRAGNVKAYMVGHHVEFLAACPISKGDELFFYYGRDYARTLGLDRPRKRGKTIKDGE